MPPTFLPFLSQWRLWIWIVTDAHDYHFTRFTYLSFRRFLHLRTFITEYKYTVNENWRNIYHSFLCLSRNQFQSYRQKVTPLLNDRQVQIQPASYYAAWINFTSWFHVIESALIAEIFRSEYYVTYFTGEPVYAKILVPVMAYYFHANVWATTQHTFQCPRTNVRKYVATWLEHSRESNRRYPYHS